MVATTRREEGWWEECGAHPSQEGKARAVVARRYPDCSRLDEGTGSVRDTRDWVHRDLVKFDLMYYTVHRQ